MAVPKDGRGKKRYFYFSYLLTVFLRERRKCVWKWDRLLLFFVPSHTLSKTKTKMWKDTFIFLLPSHNLSQQRQRSKFFFLTARKQERYFCIRTFSHISQRQTKRWRGKILLFSTFSQKMKNVEKRKVVVGKRRWKCVWKWEKILSIFRTFSPEEDDGSVRECT